jgi:hypothetical protein
MNKQQHTAQDLDTRMSRFGLRLTAGLSEQCEQLPPDISERLRVAREQALLKARSARSAQPEVARQTVVQADGSLGLQGPKSPGGGWFKLASLGPLLLLVLGLLLIQHSQWYQQIMAGADLDAALLTDKLPPAAYGDPGFSEYLSNEGETADAKQEE